MWHCLKSFLKSVFPRELWKQEKLGCLEHRLIRQYVIFLGNVIYYFEKKIEFYFDKKYFSNFISMKKNFSNFISLKKYFSNFVSMKIFFRILFHWNFFFQFYFNEKNIFRIFSMIFFWKSRWLSLRFFYCREQIQVANKPVFPSPYATPSTPPTRPNADECDGTHAQKMIEFWCRKWRAFWAFIHPPFLVSQSLTLIFYVFNFNHYNTIWPKIHKAINQT